MNAITQYLYNYYDEVEPLEFYRDLFPAGELQSKGSYQKGVYNGILLAIESQREPGKTPKIRRYMVTDELGAIADACQTDDFCLMSPITYAGRERTADNARYMYAIAVDLDKIKVVGNDPVGLRSLLERHVEAVGRIPKPTYIVSSGTGVHLYYVLDTPIAMYSITAKALQVFKHVLTEMIWHDTVCDIRSKKEIQQEGIYQGFRIPGTITKNGERARVFQIGGKVSMEYLNSFVPEACRVDTYWDKRLTKLEAQSKYPDWYERRVVNKEPRGSWHVSRRVYDWWKQQILSGATVGHRYYCIMMLAIYAKKCSFYDEKHNPQPVSRDELEADAWALLDHMEALTVEANNHFTTDDIMQALQSYDEKWLTYPRAAVEFKSGISIPANKRNGRTRAAHVKLMNFVRDELNGNKDWRNRDGAPTQQRTVQEWRAQHPDGRKADCIRDTGLSKPTVYKWWDQDLSSKN